MSIGGYYQHKAEQCDRLAAAAVDPWKRAKYEEEGVLWRQIAKDVARQDHDDGALGPMQ
jgi:hypothetical protein